MLTLLTALSATLQVGVPFGAPSPAFPVSEPRPIADEHTLQLSFVDSRKIAVVERIVLAPGQPRIELRLEDVEVQESRTTVEYRLMELLEKSKPGFSQKELAEAMNALRDHAPYDLGNWTVQVTDARIDGRPARAEHRSRLRDDELEGWWRLDVPPGARVVQIGWTFTPEAPGSPMVVGYGGVDFGALSAWGAPPKSFAFEWRFGDVPASYLYGTLSEPRPGDCKSRWAFRDGVLSIRAAGCSPRSLRLFLQESPDVWEEKSNGGRRDMLQPEYSDEPDPVCRPPPYPWCDRHSGEWVEFARLVDFDSRSLGLARNLPYACCGYAFKTPWLKDYFGKRGFETNRSPLPVFEPEVRDGIERYVGALKVLEEQAREREARRAPAR